MIYISQASDGSSVINLALGNDEVLRVPLTVDDAGTEYEMSENEYLIFSVREKPTEDSPLLLEIESDRGSNDIEFRHADTEEMVPGFYSAEVQLMTGDGKKKTVWPKLTGNARTNTNNRKNFCLMTKVVYR